MIMAAKTTSSVALTDDKKERKVSLYPDFPELAKSDTTIHPTFSHLTLPYAVVCRHRYHSDGVKYRRQFMKELHFFEKAQWKALDGVRVHREFSDGVLTMKIPRKQYINNIFPDSLTADERMRVEEIVKQTPHPYL